MQETMEEVEIYPGIPIVHDVLESLFPAFA